MCYNLRLRAQAHLVRDIALVEAAKTEVFVGNGSLLKEVPRKATFGWLFAFYAAPPAIVIQYRLHFARRL
ncbi:hypothetical protein CWI80_02025 [Pseudidiomarina sediminum]|uniref:Uncharacterized protein n=1 Tax=Pseudidiomarina sediminum TaxID=431675 RepID=A0A432Z8E0_9GAMM|nr:hypothetical protein CWI80_02025 [Pseudidiomarina sediminum]